MSTKIKDYYEGSNMAIPVYTMADFESATRNTTTMAEFGRRKGSKDKKKRKRRGRRAGLAAAGVGAAGVAGTRYGGDLLEGVKSGAKTYKSNMATGVKPGSKRWEAAKKKMGEKEFYRQRGKKMGYSLKEGAKSALSTAKKTFSTDVDMLKQNFKGAMKKAQGLGAKVPGGKTGKLLGAALTAGAGMEGLRRYRKRKKDSKSMRGRARSAMRSLGMK